MTLAGLSNGVAVDDAILSGKHGFGIPEDKLRAVKDLVDQANQPADPDEIIDELVRCASLTIRQSKDDVDLELTMKAWLEELSDYPIDAIRDVFRSWARRSKFFPALVDVISQLEQAVSFRRLAAEWIERESGHVSLR